MRVAGVPPLWWSYNFQKDATSPGSFNAINCCGTRSCLAPSVSATAQSWAGSSWQSLHRGIVLPRTSLQIWVPGTCTCLQPLGSKATVPSGAVSLSQPSKSCSWRWWMLQQQKETTTSRFLSLHAEPTSASSWMPSPGSRIAKTWQG